MRFLATIFLILLLQNAVPQKNAKSSHSNQNGNQSSDYSDPRMQVINVKPSSPNTDTQQKTTESQRPSPKWWERPSVTDWILACTTLGYVGVSVFMLIAIKRQAEIAEKSNRTIMCAEQAVFKITDIEFIKGGTKEWYEYQVMNVGKTAGTVFATYGQAQIGSSTSNPPDVSIYTHRLIHDGLEFVIEPENGHAFREFFRLTEKEWNDVQEGIRHLWACGMYCYRDAFNRPFTQRYCFLWDIKSGFRSAGSWDYRRLV